MVKRGSSSVDVEAVKGEGGGKNRFKERSGDSTCKGRSEDGELGRRGDEENIERRETNTSCLESCANLR